MSTEVLNMKDTSENFPSSRQSLRPPTTNDRPNTTRHNEARPLTSKYRNEIYHLIMLFLMFIRSIYCGQVTGSQRPSVCSVSYYRQCRCSTDADRRQTWYETNFTFGTLPAGFQALFLQSHVQYKIQRWFRRQILAASFAYQVKCSFVSSKVSSCHSNGREVTLLNSFSYLSFS